MVSCRFCAESFQIGNHMVIPCPNCGHALRVRPDYIGNAISCKFCAEKFPVSGPKDIPAPGTTESKDETRGALSNLDEKMHQRLASLEAEVQRLSGELSETVASRSQTVTELAEAREQLQRLQEESAHYQGELAHFRSSESSAAEREQDLKAANARILELQNQIQETDLLRRRLDHLEVERAQLDRGWQEERERLQASFQEEQRVRLQKAQDGWQEERVRLEQQRENLEHERDRAIEEVRAFDHAGKAQEIESLRAQLAGAQCEWREEKQRLLAEAEEGLRTKLQHLETHLHEQLTGLRQERDAALAERDRLQQEAKASQAETINRIQILEANSREEALRLKQSHDSFLLSPLIVTTRVLPVTAGRSFALDEEWAVTEIVVPVIVHNSSQESVSAWSLHSNFHVNDPSRFLTKKEFEPLRSTPYFHGFGMAILPTTETETGTIIGFKIQRREPLSFQVFYHLSGVSLTYNVVSDKHIGEMATIALKDFFDSTPLVDQIKASLREAEVTFRE
jgi:hypothetical protein